MILAADLGGTSTRLGVFDGTRPRPNGRAFLTLATQDFPDFPSMLEVFLEKQSIDRSAIDRACFGVAGPVVDDSARLTNVPWSIDARRVASYLGLPDVRLLNDLEAMAYAVPVLRDDELHTLQQGDPNPKGNVAVVAAGTGLGVAFLHDVKGQLVPLPSEGGHADFAARTDREILLVRRLTARLGRAEIEQVVSGSGIVNIHRLMHEEGCEAAIDCEAPTAPASITRAALTGRCRLCVETLEMFVEAYGAVAGNLVLTATATGGIYIGGGIAPKILPALTTGRFLRAFRSKPPHQSLLERTPVRIILKDNAGLVGAAVAALGGA
jgi:glucokinase